jgi:hypothetical protein
LRLVFPVPVYGLTQRQKCFCNFQIYPPKGDHKMPLLEIIQARQITASVRLDESTAAQVDQYAAFLRTSADEVVDKALAYVFARDRDFQEYLRTRGSTRAVQNLRIRRSPHGGTPKGDVSEALQQVARNAQGLEAGQ